MQRVQAQAVEPLLRWADLADAIERGHSLAKAKMSDHF